MKNKTATTLMHIYHSLRLRCQETKTLAQSTVSQWHAFNSCQLWRIPSDRDFDTYTIIKHVDCIYIYIYIYTCIYTYIYIYIYIYDIRRSFTVSVMPRSKTHFTVLQCPVCLMFLNLFSTRVLSNRFEKYILVVSCNCDLKFCCLR